MKTIISFWLSIVFLTVYGQTNTSTFESKFGFETITPNGPLPDSWSQCGNGYTVRIDSLEKHSGNKSLLIELTGEKPSNAPGCIFWSIPTHFEGKEIELRAFMKLQNVTNGAVGLLLRLDDGTGGLGFENMLRKNVHGTKDWALYSVKLPYSPHTRFISIGALMTGSGQAWLDDLQVLIDGKELREVPNKREYKTDRDTAFEKGSGITKITLTKTNTEALTTLGKIWGFLKYHHPAVANGNFNWDYELFRILPQVLEASTRDEVNQVLARWVASLGVITSTLAVDTATKQIVSTPDWSWINKAALGKGLAAQLDSIKRAKRTGEHYYISLSPSVNHPTFKNERPYVGMKYPDAGFRLLCLYRYWNIIQYYFPYKNLIGESWEKVLKEFIPKFIHAANELDYKLAVLALITKINDSHASLEPTYELNKYWGLNYAPVKISFVEDKAVVTGFYDSELAHASGLKIGDVIEKINGKAVKELVKRLQPYTPASNEATKLRDIAPKLLRTNDSLLFIDLIREGIKTQLQVKCYLPEKMNVLKKVNGSDTCFKLLSPDIGYLDITRTKSNYLPQIMPLALKTKGLILDLRGKPGDDLMYSLSRYLLPQEKAFTKVSTGSALWPGVFAMAKENKAGFTNDNYYKGQVVIIVNESTQSSAEFHTMAFKLAPKAIALGSTTAGTDGNVSRFELPGDLYTQISGIGIYYPNGKETQRIGIIPDVKIKRTIKGVKENRDELLEKAIEYISKSLVEN